MKTDIQWKPENSNMIHWILNMRMRSCSGLYQTFYQKTPGWVVVSRRKPPKLVYLHRSKPSNARSRTRSPLLPCEQSGGDAYFGSCDAARAERRLGRGLARASAWYEIRSRRGRHNLCRNIVAARAFPTLAGNTSPWLSRACIHRFPTWIRLIRCSSFKISSFYILIACF
jgi:hypothetical protein